MYFCVDWRVPAETFMTSCITAFLYIFLTVIFPTGTLTVALLNVQNLYFRNNKEKNTYVFPKQWCGECVRPKFTGSVYRYEMYYKCPDRVSALKRVNESSLYFNK